MDILDSLLEVLPVNVFDSFLLSTVDLAQCTRVHRKWREALPGVLHWAGSEMVCERLHRALSKGVLWRDEAEEEQAAAGAVEGLVARRRNLQRAALVSLGFPLAGVCGALARACPELRQVLIRDCNELTDAAVQHIAEGCPKLLQVVFAQCPMLTDRAAQMLVERCLDMQLVDFSGCQGLTDEGAGSLAKARAVRSLVFRKCGRLTDEAATHLTRCRPLRHVDFGGCEKVTVRSVAGLFGACAHLRQAAFHFGSFDDRARSFCGQASLTDVFVGCVAQACVGLRRVDLSACRQLTEESILHIARACPELEQISFSGELTDEAVVLMARACLALRHVDFAGCHGLTDEAAKGLAGSCVGLRRVDLSGCDLLTDKAVEALARGCRGLRHLELAECESLTDEAAKAVGRWCADLEYVGFAECGRLTGRSLGHLLGTRTRLHSAAFHFGTLSTSAGEREFRGSASLTDDTVGDLAQACPDLRRLHAQACRRLTGRSLAHLLRRCPDLEDVGLPFGRFARRRPPLGAAFHFGEDIPREALPPWGADFPRALPSQDRCDPYGTEVTDGRVQSVVEACPALDSVAFYDCPELTDDGVARLAQGCCDLQRAFFGRCPQLTDKAAKHLARSCCRLQHVHFDHMQFDHTPQLSDGDGATSHLSQACPELESEEAPIVPRAAQKWRGAATDADDAGATAAAAEEAPIAPRAAQKWRGAAAAAAGGPSAPVAEEAPIAPRAAQKWRGAAPAAGSGPQPHVDAVAAAADDPGHVAG